MKQDKVCGLGAWLGADRWGNLVRSGWEKVTGLLGRKKGGDGSEEAEMSDEEFLYTLLSISGYQNHPFSKSDLGEDMTLVSQVIGGYWKPRYVMDHEARRAFEFMSETETLPMVTDDDIDWESLEGLPEEMVDRARRHLFIFPGCIYPYENGVADVRWEINPDGRYYCDEDGFGMTNDEEVDLVGAMDRNGKVVRKFTLEK